jgi:hypothetical protein
MGPVRYVNHAGVTANRVVVCPGPVKAYMRHASFKGCQVVAEIDWNYLKLDSSDTAKPA